MTSTRMIHEEAGLQAGPHATLGALRAEAQSGAGRWSWRLLFLFALVDGAAVLSLWGTALWRSAASLDCPGHALHLFTEVLLCISTMAAVVGLLRGARFAVPLASAVLAGLLYLSFGLHFSIDAGSGLPSASRDGVVIALLAASLLYGHLGRGRGAAT